MSDDLTTTNPAFVPYGVPIPKYGIGSTFWRARVDSRTEQLPCPDCLDTRVWKVTSPVGTEHEVVCPRCSERSGYTTLGMGRVPSLSYTVYVGAAELFTVRGMDIRSHGHDEPGRPDTRISYYSSPRGGSVMYEHQAYDSEETARTVAQLQANEMNAKQTTTVERMEKARFATMRFREAAMEAAHETANNAWWAYTFLKEDVVGSIENDGAGWRDVKDLCTELQRHLEFDHGHRRQYRPPSQAPMYDALEAILRPFADLDSEHLLWLTPEAQRERVQKAANAVIDARYAMRKFVADARRDTRSVTLTGLHIYDVREDTIGHLLGIDPNRIVEVELIGRLTDEPKKDA